MKKTIIRQILSAALSLNLLVLLSACDKKSTKTDAASTVATTTASTTTTTLVPSKYLYVSSGMCYSGNNTTFTAATASNLVYRISLATGARDMILADFLAYPSVAGDTPIGLVNYDNDNVYVAVENTTNALRRILKIEKKSAGIRSTGLDYSHIGVLADTQPIRNLIHSTNGEFITTRTTRIELTSSAPARIGSPYINPSAGTCLTTNTALVKTLQLSNGKFVFLHAAAAQNRIAIMTAAGGTSCAASATISAPNANSYPSAAFYDSANSKLIVAYAGNAITTDLTSIYAYSIDETAGIFTAGTGNPQKIYDAVNYPGTQGYLLYGISEMVYDSENSTVYIATTISTATTAVNYSIEKFTYAPTNIGTSNLSVLTRVGTAPFYNYGNDTKCISQMMIAN